MEKPKCTAQIPKIMISQALVQSELHQGYQPKRNNVGMRNEGKAGQLTYL